MVCIYEDELYKNFLPLVYLRPVFELYCGRLKLYQKIKNWYPKEKIGLLVRPIISEITEEKHPNIPVNYFIEEKEFVKNEINLFISARAILNEKINPYGPEEIFIAPVAGNNKNEYDIVGFRVKDTRIKKLPINTQNILNWRLPKSKVNAIVTKYLWDFIEMNADELIKEFPTSRILGKISSKTIIIGDIKKLYVGQDAEIEAGAVIDLRPGPIYIDDYARVLALSKIIGPAYIGKNSIIDQAKISGGTTIGENCRISGEVESSIFQGYANKHHYGFIGHSYIGEWVNLGAGTTDSDLKNNYTTVKVKIGNKKIDTGKLKVGCFIGDHTKTAIGTMIPTGAVIGIFANVLMPAKSIPNFYWSKGKRWAFDKLIRTAKIVMSRRNVTMSQSYEDLIGNLF